MAFNSRAIHSYGRLALLGVAVIVVLVVVLAYLTLYTPHHIPLTTTPAAHAQTTVSGTELCPLKNDLFLNPFNRESAHHRPIGTGARYADANHPATRNWLQAASGININVGVPYGVATARATNADPLRTVIFTDQMQMRTPGGIPTTLHIPDSFNMERLGPYDNVGAVVNMDTRTIHSFYNMWKDGNQWRATHHKTHPVLGLGHGTRLGPRDAEGFRTIGEYVGIGATGVVNLFGVLRGAEINTPGMPIRHALQIALPGFVQSRCEHMLSTEIILPAVWMDNTCRARPHNSCLGTIPYGALLALPPNVNIDSLGLSEPGRRLAEAIRNYGIYVVDQASCPALRADQHIDPQVRTQLRQDLTKIYPHIRMVLNSEWQPGGGPAGGGSPIAPNCAFDAPDDGSSPTTTQVPDSVAGGGAQAGTTQPGVGVTQPGVPQTILPTQGVECHGIQPGMAIPEDYGAPYNFFRPYRDLLIASTACNPRQINVRVGDGQPDTYVFTTSYYWDGVRWEEVRLSGANTSGVWAIGTANGIVPTRAERMWYVAYTCHNTDSGWRCGCMNQACQQSRWQVQRFSGAALVHAIVPGGTGVASGGGTTSGTTGGTVGGGVPGGGIAWSGDVTEACPLKGNLFLQPFNKDSAWNRPIGTGAQYAGDNHPSTLALSQYRGRGGINHAHPHNMPTAQASPSDPLVTIRHVGAGSGAGFPFSVRLPANFPPDYKPQTPRAWDSALHIYYPSTNILHEFFKLDIQARTAELRRETDVRGTGHGSQLGQRLGTSASGISGLGGTMRAHEINTPGMPIRHAHHLVVPRRADHPTPTLLGRGIQWPATAGDNTAYTRAADNTGPLPYGALLALPPSIDLDALNPPLSEPGRRLFESVRDYGIYVVDGGENIVFRADGPIGANASAVVSDIRNHLWQNVRLVTNSVSGANATINLSTGRHSGSIGTPSWPAGGGQPIAPNCAFDA